MTNNDDKVFLARIADMVQLSERRGEVYSHFMNESQIVTAQEGLKRLRCENYCFFGGVEDADRKILCVFNEYCRPQNSDFPLTCLTFRYKPEYKLSHRDFLGALTSLNIKRETIGDILTGEGIAQIFVADSVRQTIENDILKIGSVGVNVNSNESLVLDKSQSYQEIKGTVASLRLDCVLSMALGLSRGKIVSHITSGQTEVNYKQIEDTSFMLKQKDIFSVKHYGKFRIEEISGVSKKGRLHIKVLKYC